CARDYGSSYGWFFDVW
nr:immunoglobulin heavy chain junction region [Mus musculus]MBK4184359.1 immunoglobulin heavy chain junction region [Mus musculus]MBK4186132.1 immunoglobulin heavy chain junction region [Mus musculus]MBK4186133.1 immunoglobulin heavy chain junction region [Mus musculus]MBK4186140.1 immunoglobulin heavy chain junction region [Mus musculus]